MKKLIIILTILIICITLLVGCGEQTLATEAVVSPTSTQIQYVDRIIEKPVEVEKIVEVEKEVVKTEYVEVEKPVYVEKEVVKTEYVEVPVEVEVEKEVIVEKEIIKTVEVEKYIEREYSTPDPWDLTIIGNHWDYLVVYNASCSKGENYSYVLPVIKTNNPQKTDNLKWNEQMFYEANNLPNPWGYDYTFSDYPINLSCWDYQEGEDVTQYRMACMNRTTNGRYNGLGQWCHCYNTGFYILENARVVDVYSVASLNSYPQVIIQYDHAYHAVEI